MKKILILSITAGNGHNACAQVMKNKLDNLGDCEVKIVDLLKEFSTPLKVWTSDTGYSLCVSRILPIYNAFFNRYLKAKNYNRYKSPAQFSVLTTLNGLMQEILTYKPDVIYCTHFYCAIAITDLKLTYNLPCKTVTTCLDYLVSPFWESSIGVDYFNVSVDDLIPEILSEGFRPEQLVNFGIPVDGRTLEVKDKAATKKLLGLDEDVFTLTVMFGGGFWSGGLKIFKQAVKALKGRKAQIIMINGKCKKSFNKIAKMKFAENIKGVNVGFTDDVPLYLSASDAVVTKCGGLSTTEMINKRLPLIVTEKLPAQEYYNLKYLKKKGVAFSFKNAKELKAHVLRLMNDADYLQQTVDNAKPLIKPALDDLANFILSQPYADYTELEKLNIDTTKTKKAAKAAINAAHKRERATRNKKSR